MCLRESQRKKIERQREKEEEERERGRERKDGCKNRKEAFRTITEMNVHKFSHILDGT